MDYIVEFEEEEVFFEISIELQVGDLVVYTKDDEKPKSLQGRVVKRKLFRYTNGAETRDKLFFICEIEKEDV